MPTSCALPAEIVSASDSAPGSPNNKIKFMCSHGGKILPRPSDGRLKYVGGETRVISVTRDIRFQELKNKLTYQLEGDMVLKYQLVPEDLDALVTVKSDEDLRYMIEECERLGPAGSARLRAFLFPAEPGVVESPPPPLPSLSAAEQRYVDAINGITRPGTGLILNRPVFSISSACSSPRSPENDIPMGHGNNDQMMPTGEFVNSKNVMHKVHSMPSFGHYIYTPPLNESPQSHHYHHHHHHFHGSGSGPTPTTGCVHYRGPKPNDRLGLGLVRFPGGYCYEARRERAARSASASPIPLSPRYGHNGGGFRLWDGPITSAETFN